MCVCTWVCACVCTTFYYTCVLFHTLTWFYTNITQLLYCAEHIQRILLCFHHFLNPTLVRFPFTCSWISRKCNWKSTCIPTHCCYADTRSCLIEIKSWRSHLNRCRRRGCTKLTQLKKAPVEPLMVENYVKITMKTLLSSKLWCFCVLWRISYMFHKQYLMISFCFWMETQW